MHLCTTDSNKKRAELRTKLNTSINLKIKIMGFAEMMSKYDNASDLIIGMVNNSQTELEVPETEKPLFENENDLQMIKSITARFAIFEYRDGIIFIDE